MIILRDFPTFQHMNIYLLVRFYKGKNCDKITVKSQVILGLTFKHTGSTAYLKTFPVFNSMPTLIGCRVTHINRPSTKPSDGDVVSKTIIGALIKQQKAVQHTADFSCYVIGIVTV